METTAIYTKRLEESSPLGGSIEQYQIVRPGFKLTLDGLAHQTGLGKSLVSPGGEDRILALADPRRFMSSDHSVTAATRPARVPQHENDLVHWFGLNGLNDTYLANTTVIGTVFENAYLGSFHPTLS